MMYNRIMKIMLQVIARKTCIFNFYRNFKPAKTNLSALEKN